MNKTHPPQRTWLAAVAAITTGWMGVAILSVIPHAEWKVSVRSTFLIQSEETDEAIEILQSKSLKYAFTMYSLFILGMIPFLVSFLRRRSLWISIASIFLLLCPMLWYGSKISQVAAKFVDWEQIYPEWFSEPSPAQSVSRGDGPQTNTQQNAAGQPATRPVSE